MAGMLPVVILIPAAGASRRMRDRDKLLEEVQREPILRRVARLALQSGEQVVVTLPDHSALAPARRAALAGLPVWILPITDADEGMAASLRAGAAAAGAAAGLMVLLPDMPDIDASDINLLLSEFMKAPTRPLRAATSEDIAGHPVILPQRLYARIATLVGDAGARSILEDEPVTLVRLSGHRAVKDLDTPEDWARWHNERPH